jgi:hypothetical protein
VPGCYSGNLSPAPLPGDAADARVVEIESLSS